MKVVILAGGYGTRISEESGIRPKPMVEIGGKPLIWHIMKIYSSQGFNDFVICCGYKGYFIKEYFSNYFLHNADVSFDLKNGKMTVHKNASEPWHVTLIDTGEKSMTGGRLKRVKDYLDDDTFFATYGDGLSNIDLKKLLAFHTDNKGLATITAVQPPGRFGAFTLSENQSRITSFSEKPKGDGAWVNGGFFVFNRKVLDYIEGDMTVLEHQPLRDLARDSQLFAYRHEGFWHPLDTLRDKNVLENMWQSGESPWKIW